MSGPLGRSLNSSIGMKWLMALTGCALVLFVLAHMVGNLQIFAGREKLNAYAETLQHLGPLLWLMRAGLLTIFALHVWTAFRVWSANRAARPVPYATAEAQVTGIAARTMIWSGLVVLAFLAYHVAHLTLGVTHPEHYALHEPVVKLGSGLQTYERHDVYGMVVAGFREPAVVVLYVVAQFLLCVHIWHGASSALHTLGVTHPRMTCLKPALGKVLATVVFVGNASIPLSVLTGLVK
jgi:succinate dehydrogenase / fumarate reductase, cytochrome b subunit